MAMNVGVPCLVLPHSESSPDAVKRMYLDGPTAGALDIRSGAAITLCSPGVRAPLRVHVFDGAAPRFLPPIPAPGGDKSGMQEDQGGYGGPPPRAARGNAYVPAQWLHRMRLPPGPYHLKRTDTGELHIGPVVGIFCQRYPGPALYGPQTRFFRRLIELGRLKHMFVYVFETGDVNRRTEEVFGSTWLPGRGWVRRMCPLPHVFYDRGMVTDSVMRIHRWLRRQGVHQFNGYVGSKLWVYRLVAEIPELARHIPPTTILRHPRDLVHMVRQHGAVYVKSAGGGKGIGIWVVGPHPRRGYVYRFTDARTRVHRGVAKDAGAIVYPLLQAPRQPWFIQPKLDLLQWHGRIFDVRVLVQRDRQGQLAVTGTGARVGRKGSIVSNLHGGGQALALPPLLQECLGLTTGQAQKMQQDIEKMALAIARAIDKAVRSTGTVAELGVDVAIDKGGRLWFLEANSRTGRNVFALAGMHDQARRAMTRPLDYARRVAGFNV